MAILVAGGAGYIGSHTCVQLLNSGYEAVVADNLYNSKMEAIRRVEKITGKNVRFYHVDVCDRFALREIFERENIEAVIHFAAYKAVGESVSKPLEYYSNNLISTLTLLETMKEYRIRNFVFSSSATVYGDPETVPIRENFPTAAANPYGRTKLMNEHILMDFYHACPDMNIAILRYFNPIGAHKSGLIGEDPNDIPNNLVPYITQVAVGKLEKLQIFGNDYETKDGTGVRDYIHVVDLADGHISALEKLKQNCGLVVYNLGTGRGYSVLEVVHAFEKVIGRSIPYEFTRRRQGDIAVCYADPSKARVELGWKAKYTLEEMCRDSWNWQKNNPKGYER
jgi:UDP-glucose 4-epimerase